MVSALFFDATSWSEKRRCVDYKLIGWVWHERQTNNGIIEFFILFGCDLLNISDGYNL